MVVECHLDVMSAESLVETLAANGSDLAPTYVLRNPAFGFEIATFQGPAAVAAD